jgi:hypothetical protein
MAEVEKKNEMCSLRTPKGTKNPDGARGINMETKRKIDWLTSGIEIQSSFMLVLTKDDR